MLLLTDNRLGAPISTQNPRGRLEEHSRWRSAEKIFVQSMSTTGSLRRGDAVLC